MRFAMGGDHRRNLGRGIKDAVIKPLNLSAIQHGRGGGLVTAGTSKDDAVREPDPQSKQTSGNFRPCRVSLRRGSKLTPATESSVDAIALTDKAVPAAFEKAYEYSGAVHPMAIAIDRAAGEAGFEPSAPKTALPRSATRNPNMPATKAVAAPPIV